MQLRKVITALCLSTGWQLAMAQLGAAPLPEPGVAAASGPSLEVAQAWVTQKFVEMGPVKASGSTVLQRVAFSDCQMDYYQMSFDAPEGSATLLHTFERTNTPVAELDPDSFMRRYVVTLGEREVLWTGTTRHVARLSPDAASQQLQSLIAALERELPLGKSYNPPTGNAVGSGMNYVFQIIWPSEEIQARVTAAMRDVIKVCRAKQGETNRAGTRKPGEPY